jgi:hypothetical protein
MPPVKLGERIIEYNRILGREDLKRAFLKVAKIYKF